MFIVIMLMARLKKKFIYKLLLYIYMPINLGNGLVTGNIVLRTGNGGGGGGSSVNVPANSILYSTTGTDICGNTGLQYDGNVTSANFVTNEYLNGNLARIGDYYYNSTVLLLFVDNEQNTIDNSYYKKPITVSNINYSYESLFKGSYGDIAANFDGATSYITATDSKYNIGSASGTIECMFKLNDTTAVGTIFILCESGNPQQHAIVLKANVDATGDYLAGGLSLYRVTDGNIKTPIWHISGLNTSTWYYFALSIETTTSYKVYFGEGYPNNIALQQTISTPELESFTSPQIMIGAAPQSGNFFNGWIVNFRITTKIRYFEYNNINSVQVPSYFFPKYDIGFNTNNATFKVDRDFITERLKLFIGANDSNASDIVIGCNSLTFNGGSSNSQNIVLGNGSLTNITTQNIVNNVIIGTNNLQNAPADVNFTNIIGYNNLNRLINSVSNTNILGNNNRDISGYTNCSIIGNSTIVTGNNQNQIGGSGTTTYVYGSVASRSDLRDKDDIIDIPIGVNFINKLKPKFYRWNYREDYIEYDESGNQIVLPQDGTKKRIRFHAGLIAQDVKESMDELSVDFGLYQDHLVNGGKDVKTLGYAELIPVLIKAVQELSTKNVELENRIRILENK